MSDLHFGAGAGQNDPAVGAPFEDLIERVDPALVIVSGDLTHLGRSAQHAAAARFLRGLRRPLLVVPGNHDVPFTFPTRLTAPWRRFEHEWGTTRPVFSNGEIQVVGLNSVRPWRHQSGRVGPAWLTEATDRLREGAPGALRIAVLHHQLAAAPWRGRKRPLARRHHVLRELVHAGAELIVGGHVHQGTITERHEFEVASAGAPGVVITTAPGLTRPRPRRLGEARGVLVYDADDHRVGIETHTFRNDRWERTAIRTFSRSAAPL